MKATDGLFHQVFDEVAADYPDIENEHWIVDIGAAKPCRLPRNSTWWCAQPVRRHPLRRRSPDRRFGGPGRFGQHR